MLRIEHGAGRKRANEHCLGFSRLGDQSQPSFERSMGHHVDILAWFYERHSHAWRQPRVAAKRLAYMMQTGEPFEHGLGHRPARLGIDGGEQVGHPAGVAVSRMLFDGD